jgi:hypothetical protein
VTRLTLPSCALTWARSAVLANSACGSWGQRLEPGRAVLACRVVETDEFARWCRRCGYEAAPRDSVTRRLPQESLGSARLWKRVKKLGLVDQGAGSTFSPRARR